MNSKVNRDEITRMAREAGFVVDEEAQQHQPNCKPLGEGEIYKAYREICRDLPIDFDHTPAGWIEQGIRYAERAHGIGGKDE